MCSLNILVKVLGITIASRGIRDVSVYKLYDIGLYVLLRSTQSYLTVSCKKNRINLFVLLSNVYSTQSSFVCLTISNWFLFRYTYFRCCRYATLRPKVAYLTRTEGLNVTFIVSKYIFHFSEGIIKPTANQSKLFFFTYAFFAHRYLIANSKRTLTIMSITRGILGTPHSKSALCSLSGSWPSSGDGHRHLHIQFLT